MDEKTIVYVVTAMRRGDTCEESVSPTDPALSDVERGNAWKIKSTRYRSLDERNRSIDEIPG